MHPARGSTRCAILVTAHELATTLARDPLVERILRAFAKLPERDREPILEVIERDATWCRIAEQTSGQTGIKVRPNPHASLYVHVFDQVDAPTEPLRDRKSTRLNSSHLGI